MKIKSWFLNKEFTSVERIAVEFLEPTKEKETEKAVFLCWDTEYGKIKKWIPKSCIEITEHPRDLTEIKTVATKDGRTLDVVSDDGIVVKLSDGKFYAKSTLKF